MLSFIMNYWITILFSLVVAIVTFLYRKLLKYLKNIDILEKQACLVLKLIILKRYEEINEKNFITVTEQEEILEIYNLYNALDCSNTVDKIIDRINRIPLK